MSRIDQGKARDPAKDRRINDVSGGRVAATQLWDFLGPDLGTPFRPICAEQFELLTTVQVPWPGRDAAGRAYPRIFGINCGRRFGKSTLAEIILWQGLLARNDRFGPPCIRLVADTEEHARKIWDRFIWHLTNVPTLAALVDSYSRERQLVTIKNGATVQLKSADNPRSLSGDAVTLWVVDEAQDLSQEAWENLYPSTSDRRGVIAMFGVSEGDGPFHTVCNLGDNDDYPEFLRLAYPTAANPLIDRDEIAFAARLLSPAKFKQLYLAQWVGELGKLFRNVDGSVYDAEIKESPEGWKYTELWRPGHTYYGGLDLGRYRDWSVYLIANSDGKVVAWDRMTLESWELQKARVVNLAKAYRLPSTCADSTGEGDGPVEDLIRMGLPVEGVKISTNVIKRQIVDSAAIRVGAGFAGLPNEKTMLEEFRHFVAKRSRTGHVIQYEAEAGFHDDYVLSFSLLNKKLPPMQLWLPPHPSTDEEGTRNKGEWEEIPLWTP